MSIVYPGIFGPPIWITLHMAALMADESGNPEMVAKTRTLVEAIADVLWCGYCKESFREHLKHNPVPDKELFKWTHEIHNQVNRDTGVSEMSFDDAYSNTRRFLCDENSAISHFAERQRDYAEIHRLKGLLGGDIEYLDFSDGSYVARVEGGIKVYIKDRTPLVFKNDYVNARLCGNFLATVKAEGPVELYDISGRPKVIHRVSLESPNDTSVALTSDFLRVVMEDRIHTFDIATRTASEVRFPHEEALVGVSPNGVLVFTDKSVFDSKGEEVVPPLDYYISCIDGNETEVVIGTTCGKVLHVLDGHFIVSEKQRFYTAVVDVALYKQDPETFGRTVYTDGVSIGGAFLARAYLHRLVIHEDRLFLDPKRFADPYEADDEFDREDEEEDDDEEEEEATTDEDEEGDVEDVVVEEESGDFTDNTPS